jgi:hypothetical protein
VNSPESLREEEEEEGRERERGGGEGECETDGCIDRMSHVECDRIQSTSSKAVR